MNPHNTIETTAYIQTPRTQTTPVKIDTILEQRMKSFLRARRIRRFTFSKERT